EISCEPGKTFKDKCNTCRCGADGKSAACTLKACPNQ
nr:Chain I, PROTEASE INHIBITOR LCMI II [Locusta migratoria]1GL1_J Chain J, PROTEASE INHIBITOR LCMI II [Locusta migratoria]1GL1_K Chain K, PROTEASE INHIBITOR LCMI II [Locusta migratoria]1PMC_A Chain A, PROTEINASE INHIBITOR PMP-C [Locusta migratoria]AAB21457.1 pars intercerebralis major peptide, PMP-C [Locusta migratoria, brain, Peptide, 36 aa] [Locusta migratoria]AAB24702.1 alpha-chymotrypsin inhibitor II, LMCI II=pancreatic elastase inhibitor [Locusta migratoria, hemolymph, Peptide, 36 aa] [Lo